MLHCEYVYLYIDWRWRSASTHPPQVIQRINNKHDARCSQPLEAPISTRSLRWWTVRTAAPLPSRLASRLGLQLGSFRQCQTLEVRSGAPLTHRQCEITRGNERQRETMRGNARQCETMRENMEIVRNSERRHTFVLRIRLVSIMTRSTPSTVSHSVDT